MNRGFGIPATADESRARTVAAEAERLGYSSIWTNDTPKADGILTAARMAEATHALRVGVGVVPIDRRPPVEIATEIERLGVPLDRLVLGVGSGRSPKPIAAVRDAVYELRELVGPDLCVGISAMGPQMCRLAGRIADFVLFNWMVPERIAWAGEQVSRGGADDASTPVPQKLAYIRVATGPSPEQQLHKEAAKYDSVPAYHRHFQAMGVPLEEVGVATGAANVHAELAAYDRVLDEGVVRALPASDSVESTLAAAQASAPVSAA
ncbi:MAG: LLM class flavin-dependent oxidoreductase [Actinomycetota bacterium]